MNAKAHIEWQPFGLGIAILSEGTLALWPSQGSVRTRLPEGGASPEIPEGYTDRLRLREDEARALYEALADYFGHAGHDTRSLRKDYDAERKRVDKFIDSLLEKK